MRYLDGGTGRECLGTCLDPDSTQEYHKIHSYRHAITTLIAALCAFSGRRVSKSEQSLTYSAMSVLNTGRTAICIYIEDVRLSRLEPVESDIVAGSSLKVKYS